MLSRDAVFDELGIGPVWRLRGAGAAPAAVDGQYSDRSPVLDWDALSEGVAHCTACALHRSRTQGVLGVGDRNAEWLVIGEAPGADEDALGEPFVGEAGKLLDAMLAAIGVERGGGVYITNVLKSRPPGNRDPEPAEVAACRPYLLAQIRLIRPKLILALGRVAAHSLLDTDTPVAQLRGRQHAFEGVPLVVTYHPAYLLRNLPDKSRAWEDLCFARQLLRDRDASV